MNVKQINHIGIAVTSIAENRAFYEGVLGMTFEGEEVVAEQKVKVAFFRVGEVRIELLEPTDATSTVAQFIEKRGAGVHHIAYTVADLAGRIAELKAQGVRMIDESPRRGAHQSQIAFLHPKSSCGILTEICEPQAH